MAYPVDTVLAGKLRVVRQLGEGGIGEVYEVEHQLTRHRRALKVLKPQWRGDTELVERFQREASAAAHIGNPHIVETFDAGTLEDGSPYLLMELLDGQSLDQVLRWNGRLEPSVAVQLMLQVCDAVAAANDAGIVHRDLKPENLFLLKRDGHSFVKVLDFGISKFDSSLTGRPKVTNTFTSLGTPLYMSPEQMRASKDVDARADLYSLGVILYESISGTAPFDAESFADLAAMVLRGEAKRLDVLVPEAGKALAMVVAKAMAPDRNQRFESVRAFAEALEPFAGPGVTSLTEMPQQPVAQRQASASADPLGDTARRDDEQTASGRPTEEALPQRREGDTTVVPHRGLWAALLTGLLLATGAFVLVSQRTPPEVEAATVVDAGVTSAEDAGVAPTLETPPLEARPEAPPIDAGVTPQVVERPPTQRPKSQRPPAPLAGELKVTCESDPCRVTLPDGPKVETPISGLKTISGTIRVELPTKVKSTYKLEFTRAGESVWLHVDAAGGVTRR
jgi:serine/threonine protein kinase